MRKIFRRVIRHRCEGPRRRELRAEIIDENTRPGPLRVNGSYPSDVPLSTVPPRMLEALPRLPEELEYRFVDRQLILFDNHAQIIVDYMTKRPVPPPPPPRPPPPARCGRPPGRRPAAGAARPPPRPRPPPHRGGAR